MTEFEHKRIDIHAHILPGIDDGSRTMEESLRLVKMSTEAGFDTVVATPHYSEKYGPECIREILEALCLELRNIYPQFQICSGQEILYHEGLTEKLKSGQALAIADSRYVLIEFSNGVSFGTVCRAVRRMNDAGYIPILAHVERYDCLRDKKNLLEIRRSACLLQMNYDSISGSWFQPEVRRCRKMILNGWIHLLGTDMHRTDFRKPKPQKAFKWLSKHLPQERYEALTYRNAKYVIENKDLGWIKNE